ncbi:MAG: AAA family ATPase [Actinomycetota bacterium]|nr:AAA family ATPase [Actinomycetota bacterium]
MLASLLLLTGAFVWLISYGYGSPSSGEELSLDEVYRLAAENRIQSVELLDEDSQLTGKMCVEAAQASEAPMESARPVGGQTAQVPSRCSGPVEDFHAAYPGSDLATQELIEVLTTTTGAEVVVDKQTDVAVVRLLATYIFPLLLLANLFGLIVMWRGGNGLRDDVSGFGGFRGRRHRRQHAGRDVTFDHVAGAGQAVAELREVIDYLTDARKFEAYALEPPKGVMLFGPPGCGKTLLARAVAGEAGVPCFWTSGRELAESAMGAGAAQVHEIFRRVRRQAPAIVFIDEIDVLARRGAGERASADERAQTLNQLLVEMDGLEVAARIVVVAATNRPDILDPALLGPGRFDRPVPVHAPDISTREAILKVHARMWPVAKDVDFELLADLTPGVTGADLANVIRQGALLAIHEGGEDTIRSSHLLEAVQRVLDGPGRRGRLMTAEERKRLAVHESGQAVVAAALDRDKELRRVSIMAGIRDLAPTLVSSEGERRPTTAKEMKDQLAVAMGGIAAEQLLFGEPSTLGEDDIERATGLARQMVGLYGMSSAVGRVRLLTQDNGSLRGGGIVSGPSEASEFEREVKGLIVEAERTAEMLLLRHRTELDAMVLILESEETLEGAALAGRLARIRNGQRASTPAQQHQGHPAHGYPLRGGPSEQTTEPQHSNAGSSNDARG